MDFSSLKLSSAAADIPADELELLFLGTGTSAGVPMIGCHCEVCTSSDPHDQRLRPSALISYGGRSYLIDTTPELRLQCLRYGVEMIDAVIYTHAHADHVMGLDDVRRFNALRGGPLDVWADDQSFTTISRCFNYAFAEPSPEQKVFRPHLIHRAIHGPFEIAGQRWTPVPLFHGDLQVLGFRIGRLAYCTDVSRIPDESFELLADLDVLVLDALQPRSHSTHFSLSEAVEASNRIGAKQTYFTHIAHGLSHTKTNAELPPNMRLAFDGQRVLARR